MEQDSPEYIRAYKLRKEMLEKQEIKYSRMKFEVLLKKLQEGKVPDHEMVTATFHARNKVHITMAVSTKRNTRSTAVEPDEIHARIKMLRKNKRRLELVLQILKYEAIAKERQNKSNTNAN